MMMDEDPNEDLMIPTDRGSSKNEANRGHSEEKKVG
jgi:hypothetical protein